MASACSHVVPMAIGHQAHPRGRFSSCLLHLSPGPSSIYQIEDANEDTIGVLVRLITEKKGREPPGKGEGAPQWPGKVLPPQVAPGDSLCAPTSRKCCSAGGAAEGTSEHAASTSGLQTCLQVRDFPPQTPLSPSSPTEPPHGSCHSLSPIGCTSCLSFPPPAATSSTCTQCTARLPLQTPPAPDAARGSGPKCCHPPQPPKPPDPPVRSPFSP